MRKAWLLAGLCASAAAAQPPTTPSPLIIDRNRIDRSQPPPVPGNSKAVPRLPPRVEAGDGAAGIAIRGIRFDGAKVPEPVARAAERFVGQPASETNLTRLATAMSDAYARTDVALYTVLVPQQDLSGGTVRIVVAEGFIESVRVSGNRSPEQLALVRATAERLTRERPLTRATIERSLSLIRDIPGLTLDAQLYQGSAPGAVVLDLKVKQKRVEFSAGIDNRTAELLGDFQGSATVKAYGLATEGDSLELSGAASLDFDRYRFGSVTYSVPLGADGLRLAASAAYLKTRPERVPITGEAKLASLTLSYPVLRGYRRNLLLSASLDGVDSDNAVLGGLLAQEHSRAVRGAIAFSDVAGRHSAGASLTLSRGLDALGARVLEPLAEPAFMKANLRLTLDRALGEKAVLRLRGAGQYSRDELPAVERFAVGGAEFGRAFDTAILSGDRGVAGLAELAWRPIAAKRFSGSELYGFVDAADVGIRARGPFAGADYDLASAGAGLRVAYGEKASLELEAARAIDRPYAGAGDDWRLSVGWKLSLR